ncbi:MAG: hypothetical protein AAGL96_05420 [Pseudomonadota bacterium]
MTLPFALYQDFGSADEVLNSPRLEKELDALEDAKLVSFEAGYQAGWDDAIKAQQSIGKSVSTALANNLQDASFQYHEMRAQLIRNVEELMKALVSNCLPLMAQHTLGNHICDLIRSHAQDGVDCEIELVVNPNAIPSVEAALEHVLDRYSLKSDDSLASDQAQIKLGQSEYSVDLGRAISEVDAAITDFFEAQRKDIDHV